MHRLVQVLADRHTTVTFAQLMEASGMTVPGKKVRFRVCELRFGGNSNASA